MDLITSPWFGKTDLAFVKRFRLGGSRSIEARMDLYNVFNNINFTPIGCRRVPVRPTGKLPAPPAT